MSDWSKPTLTSNYSDFVAEVKGRDDDLAKQFDGTTSPNVPSGTIRWNSSNRRHEKWNGSSWAELVAKATTAYAIRVEISNDSDNLGGLPSSAFMRVDSGSSGDPKNANFAVGQANGRNFIQSHQSQPLDLNPLGNAVTINNYSVLHAANFGSYALPLSGGALSGDLYAPRFVINANSDLSWGGLYGSGKPTISANATTIYFYPTGNSSGGTFWIDSGSTNTTRNFYGHAGVYSGGILEAQGQLRASGWWGSGSGAYGGLATEVGVSGGVSYIISYNRNNSSYGSLEFNATNIRLVPQGGALTGPGGSVILHAGNVSSYALPVTGNASTSGGLRSTANWGGGMHNEQITARGSYASLALRATNGNANVWLMHNDAGGTLWIYHAADGNPDSNSWTGRFRFDQSGQLWGASYGWLHDYFFNSVGNCAGQGTASPAINCYGSGNILGGYRHELIDNGGQVALRTVNYFTNCNCDCACGL